MRPGNVVAAGQRRRVKLADVAERAGVHPGTASRALSPGRKLMVGEATMQRVRQAAADLGYEPDLLARALRTHRSHTVGLLMPGFDDPSVLPLLRGAEDALAAAGYAALIGSTGGRDREAAVARMRARHVDGLIIAGRLNATLPPSAWPPGLPVVVAGGLVDHELGARLVLDHLAGLGHRRIGRISLSVSHTDPSRPPNVVADLAARASTAQEGARCATQLLDQRCTAIAAPSDLLAAGCLAALAETGLRCPEDVTVTGYGDTPLSAVLSPPLTTVRLPYFQVGQQAAALLLTEITDVTAEAETRYAAPELMIRASSGPPGLRAVRLVQG